MRPRAQLVGGSGQKSQAPRSDRSHSFASEGEKSFSPRTHHRSVRCRFRRKGNHGRWARQRPDADEPPTVMARGAAALPLRASWSAHAPGDKLLALKCGGDATLLRVVSSRVVLLGAPFSGCACLRRTDVGPRGLELPSREDDNFDPGMECGATGGSPPPLLASLSQLSGYRPLSLTCICVSVRAARLTTTACWCALHRSECTLFCIDKDPFDTHFLALLSPRAHLRHSRPPPSPPPSAAARAVAAAPAMTSPSPGASTSYR